MKITVIQTVIVIEDDSTAQPRRQPPVNPLLELIHRLQWEAAHGRDEAEPRPESTLPRRRGNPLSLIADIVQENNKEQTDGSYVPQ